MGEVEEVPFIIKLYGKEGNFSNYKIEPYVFAE